MPPPRESVGWRGLRRLRWCLSYGPRDRERAVLACMVVCLVNAAIYDALIGDYLMAVIGLSLALGYAKQREATQ